SPRSPGKVCRSSSSSSSPAPSSASPTSRRSCCTARSPRSGARPSSSRSSPPPISEAARHDLSDHPKGSPRMETNHQRIDEFKAEIGSLNIRTPADESERIWLIAGIVLAVLGLVLIGIGWYSASGEVLVANQIPYLLSGGVVGLALVIIGAALFVRYS